MFVPSFRLFQNIFEPNNEPDSFNKTAFEKYKFGLFMLSETLEENEEPSLKMQLYKDNELVDDNFFIKANVEVVSKCKKFISFKWELEATESSIQYF